MLTGVLAVAALAAPPLAAAPDRTRLLPVVGDRQSGRIVATFPAPGKDGVAARFLYVSQLESGVGSAPLALDFGFPITKDEQDDTRYISFSLGFVQ